MNQIRIDQSSKKQDSIYVRVTSTSPSKQPSNRSNLIHVAEVHDSKSKLLGTSSGDENWAQQTTKHSSRKQPVLFKKKHRAPRKGSETDTLSEVDSDGGMEKRLPRRQDTDDTSDKSTASKPTLEVPSTYTRTIPQIDISTSSFDTSSTKDSHQNIRMRKTRHREPRRGSLTDTLSEATDSESTIARRPIPLTRPSLDTTGDSQDLISQESMDQLSIDIPHPSTRSKKLKRKRRGGEDKGEESRTENKLDKDVISQQSTDEMIAVRIEGCESLRFLDFCRSPAIRLHVVDSVSGNYKQSSYQPDTIIHPLETQPFNMKLHRSVRPTWDEDLLIKEPSTLIISKDTLLLFELFDYIKQHVVAWAFLKLVATNGASNVGKPLRLQLFKPNKNGKLPDNGPKCFSWWIKGKFSQYKSTLFVSVNYISNEIIDKTNLSDKQIDQNQLVIDKQTDEEDATEVMWSRYPGQSCKLPNSLLAEKDCGKDGSLCLMFSHNGLLLAAPISSGILIYSIPSTNLYLTLEKQQGLIYDVQWSLNDEYLVSVSADSTACLWNIKDKITNPIKILAHPSYLYCCCWVNSDLFATGCNDGIIRIWSINEKQTSNNDHQPLSKSIKNAINGQSVKVARNHPGYCSKSGKTRNDSIPIEYLVKHSSRVNSLSCCEKRSNGRTDSTGGGDSICDYLLVSADNNGIIILWKYDANNKKFDEEKEFKLRELRGQIVNKVIFVNKKKDVNRLLVQTRDSLIRLIDLNSNAVLQVYEGGYVVKSKTGYMTLCGCARRIWSPSEDSCLITWDYATGQTVATYSVHRISQHAMLSLAHHPLDHIIAFTAHSPNDYPKLTILNYDREGDGSNVGQVVVEPGRRNGSNRHSSLDTPLYEVPAVRVEPPDAIKRPSSPSQLLTPSSKLSPCPTPLPRSTRRFSGEGTKIGLEKVATALTNLPTNTERVEKKIDEMKLITPVSRIPILTKNYISRPTEQSSSRHSPISRQSTTSRHSPVSPVSRDSRLNDIIGKMDLILVQANPKIANVK